ncbi:MAG: pyridoxamine 5'-phosphate oxidase family protein [Candidatus Eisenbacteria bacterium]
MESRRGSLLVFALVMSVASVLAIRPTARAEEPGAGAAPEDTLLSVARELIGATRFCALVTLDESCGPRVRTMDPFPPEDDMVLWLGTNRNSRKVQDIRRDPRVALHYMHPEGRGYVSVYGTARLVDDPGEKETRWKEAWARYYPDNRAAYLLIAVTPERIELIDYVRGIGGDSESWIPASVDFGGNTRD